MDLCNSRSNKMEATFNNFFRNASSWYFQRWRKKRISFYCSRFQDSKHFLITSPFEEASTKTKNPSKHDRMHMRINGEKEQGRREKGEKEKKKRKEKKGPRAGYGFAGRIAPCLYNNVIAANEENWYKIAGSSGPIRGGPLSEREQHNARGSDRAGRSPMAAAATSAAISMEMRWMSAISYDKISAQKRPKPGARPWYSATTQTVLLKTCALFASPFLFPSFDKPSVLLPSLSNGYQSSTGEKREAVTLILFPCPPLLSGYILN